MRKPERTLRTYMADALRREAPRLTAAWVDAVSGRLDVDRREVLPSELLLDLIPECLQSIADSVENAEPQLPLELIRDHIGVLVHLRRNQGFGVNELLAEYEVLGSLLQDFTERALSDFDGAVPPATLAAVMGDLKEAVGRFGLETARSYRIWETREQRDRMLQTTTFATVLRHELRNQLGSAQTAAELLAEGDVDVERRRRLAGLVLRSIEQALETVDVVRDIITGAADDPDDPTWLPLPDIVHGVVSGIRSVPTSVEVEVHGVPDVLVPSSRVSMILLNLVDNALKFADEHKDERWVRIQVETEDGLEDGSDRVRITVADNGRGVDPAIGDSLFQFGVRGHDPESGSGLGLALSRDIARGLGGDIELESEPGAGTRVSLVIPFRREAAADRDAGVPAA